MAKKFKFQLEALKKHRRRLEDEAQRTYLAARAELDACLSLIERYYRSIEEARLKIAQAQLSGAEQSLTLIRFSEQFIEGQKARIERQRALARELMIKVEDAQELLIEAARELKKIEKLKSKRMAEHKQHQKRLEAKRLDDLVVIRAGRKEVV